MSHAVGEQVYYYSQNKNTWYGPTAIVRVDEGTGYLEVEIKRGVFVSPSVVKKILDASPSSGARRPGPSQQRPLMSPTEQVAVGEVVQWLSTTHGARFAMVVTAVDPNGSVQLNLKPGVWITLREQAEQMMRSRVRVGVVLPLSGIETDDDLPDVNFSASDNDDGPDDDLPDVNFPAPPPRQVGPKMSVREAKAETTKAKAAIVNLTNQVMGLRTENTNLRKQAGLALAGAPAAAPPGPTEEGPGMRTKSKAAMQAEVMEFQDRQAGLEKEAQSLQEENHHLKKRIAEQEDEDSLLEALRKRTIS